MAIINRAEASAIEAKVIQIVKLYPQALFYPFKVIESNIIVNVLDAEATKSSLFTKLQRYLSMFTNLNAWIEALDCLIYPEHRFKYWSQIIQDMLNGELKPDQISKLKSMVKMMLDDLIAEERPNIESEIGRYNRQFANRWQKLFNRVFTARLTNS